MPTSAWTEETYSRATAFVQSVTDGITAEIEGSGETTVDDGTSRVDGGSVTSRSELWLSYETSWSEMDFVSSETTNSDDRTVRERYKTSTTGETLYSETASDVTTSSSSFGLETSVSLSGDWFDPGETTNEVSVTETTSETETVGGNSTETNIFHDDRGVSEQVDETLTLIVPETESYSTSTRTAVGANTQSTTSWSFDCDYTASIAKTEVGSSVSGEHTYNVTRIDVGADTGNPQTVAISYINYPGGVTVGIKESAFDRAADEVLWFVRDSVKPGLGHGEELTGFWRDLWSSTDASLSFSLNEDYTVELLTNYTIITVSTETFSTNSTTTAGIQTGTQEITQTNISYNGVFVDTITDVSLTTRETIHPLGSWQVIGPTSDESVEITTQWSSWDSVGRSVELGTSTVIGAYSDYIYSLIHASWWRCETTTVIGNIFQSVTEDVLFDYWVSQTLRVVDITSAGTNTGASVWTSTRWDLLGSTKTSSEWNYNQSTVKTHGTCIDDALFVTQMTVTEESSSTSSISGSTSFTVPDPEGPGSIGSTITNSAGTNFSLLQSTETFEQRTVIKHEKVWIGRETIEGSERFGHVAEWQEGEHDARVWAEVAGGGFLGFGGEGWSSSDAVYSALDTGLVAGQSLSEYPVALWNLPVVTVAKINDDVAVKAWPTADHACIGSIMWGGKFKTVFSTDSGVKTRASLLVTYTETVATTTETDVSTTRYPATVGLSVSGLVSNAFFVEHPLSLKLVTGDELMPLVGLFQTGSVMGSDWGAGDGSMTLTYGAWTLEWWSDGDSSPESTLETTITNSAETIVWTQGRNAGVSHEPIHAIVGDSGSSVIVEMAARYLV